MDWLKEKIPDLDSCPMPPKAIDQYEVITTTSTTTTTTTTTTATTIPTTKDPDAVCITETGAEVL